MDEEAQIRFIKGAMAGRVVPLGEIEQLTFGRGDYTDVRLPDAMASKMHFILERRGTSYYILDRRSTNGTFINGESVVEQRLFHNDVIRVGAMEMLFHCPSEQKLSSTIHFISPGRAGGPQGMVRKRTEEMLRDIAGRPAEGGATEGSLLHLLYDLTNLLSSEIDPQILARKALERIAESMEMQRGIVVDAELKPVAGFAIRGQWSGALLPPFRGIIEEAARKGIVLRRTVPLADRDADPDATRSPVDAVALALCAPLRGPEGTSGALYLDRVVFGEGAASADKYTDEHLSVLALAGRHLGLAVERGRRLREKFLSEERYRILVEEANDCIFLLDPEGRFDFANRRALPLLGLDAPQLLGNSILDLLPGALREGVRSRVERAISTGEPQVFETEIHRPDSVPALLHVSISPLTDGAGRSLGLLGIAREISQERKLQERMIQAERLLTMGQLVAGAAHELNNPLTSILGFSEMFSTDPSLPEPVRKRLGMIFQEAERARDTVKNLLQFAQPRRDSEGMMDVNVVVEKAVELARHQIQRAGIEVITSLDEVPAMPGDEPGFIQVILAMLTNSVQALAMSGRKGRIVLRSWRIESEVHVAVSDNGPGIPGENIKRIFDPFFTTKAVGQGMGLGLSVCYRTVTSRGGRISVDSSPEEGTTFEITLPIEPDEAEGP